MLGPVTEPTDTESGTHTAGSFPANNTGTRRLREAEAPRLGGGTLLGDRAPLSRWIQISLWPPPPMAAAADFLCAAVFLSETAGGQSLCQCEGEVTLVIATESGGSPSAVEERRQGPCNVSWKEADAHRFSEEQ